MYVLKKFGTFELPDKMPTEDIGTGDTRTSPVDQSGGGAFDALGSAQAKFGLRTVNKTGLFYFTDADDRTDYYRSLRALVGTTARLYRVWDNGDTEWVTARFKSISAPRVVSNQYHLSVNMKFEIYSPVWNGEYTGTWYLDSGEYIDTGLYLDSGADAVILDSSPKVFAIENGNAVQTNMTITVTAGTSSITNVLIAGNDAEIQYAGTLTSGKELVIDTGALTVENDGTDDIANFTRTSNHSIEEWFKLIAGSNSITVTLTGGSTDSTINFDYNYAQA